MSSIQAKPENEPVETGLEYSKEQLDRNRRFGFVTRSNVVYDEELAGPHGMSFVLLREEATTDDMIRQAVQQLRSDRDVVGRIKITGIIK